LDFEFLKLFHLLFKIRLQKSHSELPVANPSTKLKKRLQLNNAASISETAALTLKCEYGVAYMCNSTKLVTIGTFGSPAFLSLHPYITKIFHEGVKGTRILFSRTDKVLQQLCGF